MTPRTHLQLIVVIDPKTLKAVDAYPGSSHVLGLQDLKGLKHYGMIFALLTEVRTASVQDSWVAMKALIKTRHSWVLKAFPDNFQDLKDPYGV